MRSSSPENEPSNPENPKKPPKRNEYNSAPSNPYIINAFISNSRLIKSLPPSSYKINSEQLVDIQYSFKSNSIKIGILFLTMDYHIKFPRYLEHKLESLESHIKGSKK